MPYTYSNQGLSIRWEDETYELKDGEIASDIFVPPPQPLLEQSSGQAPQQSAEHSAPLPSIPAPPLETRLATIEARLEQFFKIATSIAAASPQP